MSTNLLFISRIFGDEPPYFGVYEKLMGQVQAFVDFGKDVDFVTFSTKGLMFNNHLRCEQNLSSKILRYLYYYKKLYDDLLRIINAGEYSTLYLRHFLHTRETLLFYQKIKESIPSIRIIIEIPTYPYQQEYTSYLGKVMLKLEANVIPQLPQYIDRIVHFGISSPFPSIMDIPIQNGVTVQKRSTGSLQNSEKMVLIGIGNMEEWWGIDLLLKSLSTLSVEKLSRIEVRLYGSGSKEKEWKVLTRDLNLSEIVHWKEAVHPSVVSDVLSSAHLGIGTLAIQRKSVEKSSSLKHRTFAAHGLPFIYRGSDPDFDDLPWVYNGLLDIEKILIWYDDISTIPMFNQLIIDYASDHLSWKIKMKPVMDYLNT